MVTLRPYQQDAVDAAVRHFQASREPAVIVLPTGAGKSLVIAELARIAKGRVLVLAHVKELVEQNHAKYLAHGLSAGIFSAGLERKDRDEKVIFGSIQSVARADGSFFQGFSLLVVDECHRVSVDGETQYAQVITRLRAQNPALCVLGLTATPYRLGLGWIYQFHTQRRLVRTEEERFFRRCIHEVSLRHLVERGDLTRPVLIDAPVAAYDFSRLKLRAGSTTFATADIEAVLQDHRRVTPGIVANIVDLAKDRQAVMIFTASVRHAREILELLPPGQSALVVGETSSAERDDIIQRFKARQLKFLVNVSVLTTGFDAPHVDVIALLRPTESVSLFQQIVGRGLRQSPGKSDCIILDYTGQGHDLFRPEIDEDRPSGAAVAVVVPCPSCGHENEFWGLVDRDGDIVEHFGRRCRGATVDPRSGAPVRCTYRFRYKNCGDCGAENDVAARACARCGAVLVDNDRKLKEAMALKDAHVMRVDSMAFERTRDRKGNERLEIRYHDVDGQALKEWFYLGTPSDARAFQYNFARMHLRRPEVPLRITSVDDVLQQQQRFRTPTYVIARRKERYWQVREKIFE
ncbi:MAG: DEAD/DEAH box helicase [Myxococcota bacterium]